MNGGSEFKFLNLDDVLLLHELQIDRYGGASGIRDQGLLESALNMPQASFGGDYVHDGIYEMAAAMLFILLKTNPLLTAIKERHWLRLWYF